MTSLASSNKNNGNRFNGKMLGGIYISKDSQIVKIWSKVYNDISSSSSSSSTTESASELANTTNATGATAATSVKVSDACEVIRKAGDPTKRSHNKNSDGSGKICVPIPLLEAIVIVTEGQQQHRLLSFDEILSTDKNVSLCFTSTKPSVTSMKDNDSFQKRLQRLRLQQEETKYNKLTTNLQDQRQDDDITAKSMTYAASVGLNMVIAPLSFGCFMYFFAGGFMDYFFANDNVEGDDDDGGTGPSNNATSGGQTDIKRVIIGVISGVAMMFIEMILFVIRTHEFEEHSRKKKIKQHKQGKGGVRPFGAYSKDMPTEYYSKPPPPSSSETARKSSKFHLDKKRSEPTTEEEFIKKKN